MGGEEGTSNGDTEWLKREELTNGCGVRIEHDLFYGSSSLGEVFRTYKRRKPANSSSEGKSLEDWTSSVETADKNTDQNLRDVVLEHLYQSFSDDEGGIQGCIREALLSHPETDRATKVKGSDTLHGDRNTCLQTGIHNGNQYPTKSHVGVISDGPLHRSDRRINTDMCQRAFLEIITSEKFTLLCKVLLGNFQGIKVDRVFDLCAINSRMKQGAYENSPMQFMADVQQVWKKFQEIGAEIITLAEKLSELSQTSYIEHVGGSAHCTFGEGKNELSTVEPDSGVKVEQTTACDAYKVHTCRQCEEKAGEKDGLVCDSCEEMYHVSCIEPAFKDIPPKSWYCARCTAKGFGSPHENCIVCERLNANAPRIQFNQAGDEICPTNGETSTEIEENSNCTTANVDKPTDNGIDSRESVNLCKICGSKVEESSDKFRSCAHTFCYSKFYHERCLTPKQLKRYGPQWFCPSCLCRACLTDKDDDKIVMCDACDQGYHIYCMEPPRTSVPKGKWFCRKCDSGIQEIRRVKRAYVHKLKKQCEEESAKGRGGMEMLLTAARTLNFQDMAAIDGGR